MNETALRELYIEKGLSMAEIAQLQDCSVHKVVYWMTRHQIVRRSRSEAIYRKNHPNGDPFTIVPITTPDQALLQGLGLGLRGTRQISGQYASAIRTLHCYVRLSNSS